MIVQYTNPRFESEVPSVWNSIIARFDMVRVTDGREEPHAFLRLDAFQQCFVCRISSATGKYGETLKSKTKTYCSLRSLHLVKSGQ